MKTALLAFFLLLGMAGIDSPATAEDTVIGLVKTLSGSATVRRGGTAQPVRLGLPSAYRCFSGGGGGGAEHTEYPRRAGGRRGG